MSLDNNEIDPTKTTFKVQGVEDESQKRTLHPEIGKGRKHFTVSHAINLESTRASGVGDAVLENLNDDDVIELNFESDLKRWVTVAEFKAEFGDALARDRATGQPVIPTQLPMGGGTTRGIGSWILKGLRVFNFDPAEKVAEALASFIDGRLVKEPGLYQLESIDVPRAEAEPGMFEEGKPALILIHGTISSISGSFGKLSDSMWQDLRKTYGERIFGFDHHTLTKHPIQNALEVIQRDGKDVIPDNSIIHLITTSRGGLVGELLVRGNRRIEGNVFDELDARLFDEHPVSIQSALVDLNDVLKRKKLMIDRFVRIACPSGGTTLASGRLDKWLEGILNVMGKVTGLSAHPIYGIATDFLLDVKKCSAKPGDMPGMAAQMPASSLIRMLNRMDVEVDGSLSVIAGDIQGSGILGKLGVFLTDLFYMEDHDLVVPTRAMYGGARRDSNKSFFYFDKGPGVNHFSYFANTTTSDSCKAALVKDHTELPSVGFQPIAEAIRSQAARELRSRSYQKRSGVAEPVVYVLPGIMGSHLSRDGNRIWLDIFDLALGGMAKLSMDADGIEADSPVGMSYARIVDYLSSTHEVIPFPFDWRLSILDEARRFGDVVQRKLEETDQPVRILAHSMGGLVAQAAFAQNDTLWNAFKERTGSRIVLLGVPTRGSYNILQVFARRSRIFKVLAVVDLRHKDKELLEILARYRGLLEMLPTDAASDDYFDTSTWESIRNVDDRSWKIPDADDLRQARELQNKLATFPISSDHVIYVAGCDDSTPMGIETPSNGSGIRFIGTAKGDGSVPWDTGIPDGLEPWYMEASHGNLADHPPSFAALFELLDTGRTTLLPRVAPMLARSTTLPFELKEEQLEIFPTQQADLESMLLGVTQEVVVEPSHKTHVEVEMAHGDLAFCRHPVAVGHYIGDGLYSAERYLDYLLDNRLSSRYNMGVYPGPLQTVEVLLEDGNKKPGGAIIVGLGKVGELSPQKLSESFTHALLEYAIKYVERRIDRQEELVRGVKFSTLLIGTNDVGISLQDSIVSILKSVVRANRVLNTMKAPYNVFIDAVHFIELYKDRAVQALRVLKQLDTEGSLNTDDTVFNIKGKLSVSEGGKHRIASDQSQGWWQRISVRDDKAGNLVFTTSRGRARAEESTLSVQRKNIDLFIKQAVGTRGWDPDLASALFELMIPNSLKGLTRDQENVLMEVDGVSAQYPWEMLHNRRSGHDRPIVTELGYIRQLATSTYREQVKDVMALKAYIVGNPADLTDDFVSLPGAVREAELVQAKLDGHRYEVKAHINAGVVPIMTSLMADDYKVIHLAGHGEHGYNDGEISGMVLGNGVFITANELRQMQRVPDLVFVNCCFLGTLDSFPSNSFAASFSRELINMGVRAVVAAGWAVDDTAALTFADTFYDSMLRGDNFGEAVQRARAVTYEEHGERTNTWGAYQCYGDPTYTLDEGSSSDEVHTDEDFVDQEELKIYVDNFISKAQTASWRSVPSLQDELQQNAKRFNEEYSDWMDDGVLKEQLARAFGEVFLFENAITYFEEALRTNKASIKAAEQLANFKARYFAESVMKKQLDVKTASSKIRESIDTLEKLNDTFGDTPERLALLGSAYKRYASVVNTRRSRMQKLENSADHYARAVEEANRLKQEDPYHLINKLFMQTLRYWVDPTPDEPLNIDHDLKKLLETTEEREKEESEDFWAAIGVQDARLVELMYNTIKEFDKAVNKAETDKKKTSTSNKIIEQLKEGLAEIEKGYVSAWMRFGSARKLKSVINQVEVVAAIFKEESKLLDGYVDKEAAVEQFSALHQRLESRL